jgi:hypothetical protein
LSLTLTACGTASLARRDASGGHVALAGGYMRAMSEARLLVAETCMGHFDVSEFQHGLSFQCQNAPEPERVSVAQR